MRIAALRARGLSHAEIASEVRTSDAIVHRVVREAGGTAHLRLGYADFGAQMVAWYGAGAELADVATEIGCSAKTAVRMLRRLGAQLRTADALRHPSPTRRARAGTQERDARIVALHARGLTLVETADDVRLGLDVVKKAVRAAGGTTRVRVGYANFGGKMVTRYAGGATLGDVADEIGCSAVTAARMLRRRGAQLRTADAELASPPALTRAAAREAEAQARDLEIVALYKGGASIGHIVRTRGWPRPIVSKAIHEAGLPVRRPSYEHLAAKMKTLYEEDARSIAEVASAVRSSTFTVRRHLRRLGVELRPASRSADSLARPTGDG